MKKRTRLQTLDHDRYGHCAVWNQERACGHCVATPPSSWAPIADRAVVLGARSATGECENCSRPAVVLVLVPWIHQTTRETGADPMGFCRRCEPTGETWARRPLGMVSVAGAVAGMPSIEDTLHADLQDILHGRPL